MRTLVVSDLHLGLSGGGDVLRSRPEALRRLLGALEGVQRLVLLGDVLELRQGPVREALAAARPVLGELGAALGEQGEVVVGFGNHDHHLLDGWLARRAAAAPPPPLGRESPVEWVAGEPLSEIAQALSPARVRAAYPGVWLSAGTYAIHGHYLDAETTLPTFERLGAGAMARLARRPLPSRATPEDYEALLAPLYAWLHAVAQRGTAIGGVDSNRTTLRAWARLRSDLPGARRGASAAGGAGGGRDGSAGAAGGWRVRAVRAAFPAAVAALNAAGLGPLRAELNAHTLRESSLQAIGRSVERLGVPAAHVVFGHTHRAGPLPADNPRSWRAPGGARLINSGSWVHEPAFLGPDPASSPYRPGFAVLVEDDRAPRLVNLLDGKPG